MEVLMQRRILMVAVVAILAMTAAAPTFAQDAAPPPPIDWKPIAAAGVGVLTMLLVQLAKMFVPKLEPGVKQVLALVAAPLLTWAASILSGALGHPIDFSSLIEAILVSVGSGLGAIGLFEVSKKAGVLK
jgi:hypothetical protein